MNHRYSLFAATAIVVLLFGVSGCYYYDDIEGSGILVERELAYTGFDSIDIEIDGSAVTITPSAEFGITLTADDNIIDLVTVYPAEGGNTLQFALDRRARYDQVSVNLHIRMPSIANLTLGYNSWYYYYNSPTRSQATIESGFTLSEPFEIGGRAADLSIEGLSATDLSIDWSSGDLIGTISCTDLDFYTATSGSIDLSGTATNLDIEASGSEDIDLSALDVTDATVSILSTADVLLAASGSISGTISVGGSLTNDVALSPDTSELIDDNLAEEVE